MNRKPVQEFNLMEDRDISPSTSYRNKLFRPWFEKDNWGVEIIDGFYKDTIVQFKEIEMIESDDGNVSLDYHLIHKPSIVSEEDIKSSEFSNLLTIIIEDILREALTHETRNNDTEESDS